MKNRWFQPLKPDEVTSHLRSRAAEEDLAVFSPPDISKISKISKGPLEECTTVPMETSTIRVPPEPSSTDSPGSMQVYELCAASHWVCEVIADYFREEAKRTSGPWRSHYLRMAEIYVVNKPRKRFAREDPVFLDMCRIFHCNGRETPPVPGFHDGAAAALVWHAWWYKVKQIRRQNVLK